MKKVITLSNGIELVLTSGEQGFSSEANEEFELTYQLIVEKHLAHLDFALALEKEEGVETTELILNIVYETFEEVRNLQMADMFGNIGESLEGLLGEEPNCEECEETDCPSHPLHTETVENAN